MSAKPSLGEIIHEVDKQTAPRLVELEVQYKAAWREFMDAKAKLEIAEGRLMGELANKGYCNNLQLHPGYKRGVLTGRW